ncbi:MAG: MBL fold metallo-hydrolase [Myxococcota bacterium]
MLPLFHHDLIVAPLGSGSRGNCTYVGSAAHGLLVDCGLSTRQVLLRLEAVGLDQARIDGVLVTHEHSDHVGAARILSRRLHERQGSAVPFFLTRGTEASLNPRCRPEHHRLIVAGQPFRVGPFEVTPTRVPHDVLDPVAYLVGYRGRYAFVVTDLGRSTRLIERQLSQAHLAVVEFNHDLEMLLDGPYPWSLKQRVRGNHGHLSNEQAADLVANGASDRLKHLLLAHLSDDNNLPERALDAAHRALHRAGLDGVQVQVAPQERPATPAEIEATEVLPSVRPKKGKSRRRNLPLVDSEPRIQLPLFMRSPG